MGGDRIARTNAATEEPRVGHDARIFPIGGAWVQPGACKAIASPDTGVAARQPII